MDHGDSFYSPETWRCVWGVLLSCAGVAEEGMGRGRAAKKHPGNRSTTNQGDSDEISIRHQVQTASHRLPVL
jgi:hypothetical protein